MAGIPAQGDALGSVIEALWASTWIEAWSLPQSQIYASSKDIWYFRRILRSSS